MNCLVYSMQGRQEIVSKAHFRAKTLFSRDLGDT